MSGFKGFSETQITQETLTKETKKKPSTSPSNKRTPEKPPVKYEVPPEALLSKKPTFNDAKDEEKHDPDILVGVNMTANSSNDQNEESTVSKVEALEKRQKEMEEENKRKRQLLLDAIADRRQKTADEAQKLTSVQSELQKIDLLVAQDVKILRQTIETASIDYLEAQKRYDQAEKEFINAKICLHSKQERKELLTEHLMTIIEQSESRKAKKLAELMTQLQICDS